MSEDSDVHAWESGWDGHERAQLLRMARLTLAEKLEWLEEAQSLVLELRREPPGTPSEK